MPRNTLKLNSEGRQPTDLRQGGLSDDDAECMKDICITLHKTHVKRIKELSKNTGAQFSTILQQAVRLDLPDVVEDEIWKI